MLIAQERILQVLQMRRRRVSQAEIARRVGISRQRVNVILKSQFKRIAEECDEEARLLRAQSVDDIDEVIREAYSGWEKSKCDAEKESEEIGQNEKGDTYKLAKVKEGQSGDPRFLAVIIQAIDKRTKLLGLYPEKQAGETNVNVNVGVAVTSAVEQMSDDQLQLYIVEAGRIAGTGTPPGPAGADTIDVVPALPPAKATPVPPPDVP